jgi:hypothetical protein
MCCISPTSKKKPRNRKTATTKKLLELSFLFKFYSTLTLEVHPPEL